jgi:hypothetical protein
MILEHWDNDIKYFTEVDRVRVYEKLEGLEITYWRKHDSLEADRVPKGHEVVLIAAPDRVYFYGKVI